MQGAALAVRSVQPCCVPGPQPAPGFASPLLASNGATLSNRRSGVFFVGRVNGGGPGHFGDEPGLPGLTKSPHSPVFDSGSALRNPWAEGFWPEGSARIESTRGGEWFIPDVVRQRDAPSRDHLGGRLVLQSILCPSCGSVGARVEHPMSTEGSIREADLLHCLECDYLWTLAIPQYPETG